MSVRILVCALLAMIGGPATAAAGPIAFSVSVATQQTPGAPSPGPLELAFDTQGNLQLAPGGSVELGFARFGLPGGPQAVAGYDSSTLFSVSVTVTDTASGRAGALRVDGQAVDRWDHREWDGRWTNPYHNIEVGDYWLREPFFARTNLGAHEYVLRVETTEDGAAAVFSLSVAPRVTVANPEPASLLLGAIALLPLGLRALRQRLTKVRAHDPRGGV
ncbi:hypothetical protein [Gemmata sp.]|uniref:hypothetical protein n=1 Tax=Gemmata sp. TaxID=1914242 RepID=UPI003F6E6E0C